MLPLLSLPCRLLAAGALAALAACSSDSPEVAPGSAQALSARSDALVQTHWQLVRWTLSNGKNRSVTPSRAKPITLSFARNQDLPLMFGFSGCNRYSGTYVVSNGQLLVPQAPVSTRMACVNNTAAALERDYLAALVDIRTSRFEGEPNPSRMTLELGSGDTLVFDRVGGATE